MEEVKEVNVALEETTEVVESEVKEEVKETIEETEVAVSVEEDCEGFEEVE